MIQKIKQGDVIIAKEAIPGKQPVISIKDLKQEEEFRFSVIIDEVLAEVPVIFYKDGEQLQDDYIIKPMDRLTTRGYYYAYRFVRQYGNIISARRNGYADKQFYSKSRYFDCCRRPNFFLYQNNILKNY